MGRENRKQKRVKMNIDVDVSHESKMQKLYSENLSKGGIYLKSEKPMKIGSEVTIDFFIEELNKKFKLKAVVVHVHKYESFDDDGNFKEYHGMGLKFVDISGDDQSVIDKFILGKELKQGV